MLRRHSSLDAITYQSADNLLADRIELSARKFGSRGEKFGSYLLQDS